MKKLYTVVFLLLSALCVKAQEWNWTNKISTNLIYIPFVKINPEEDIYVASGGWADTTRFTDIHNKETLFRGKQFLARYNRLGEIIWIKSLDSVGDGGAFFIETDKEGNLFLASRKGGPTFTVRKYTKDGALIWTVSEKIPNAVNTYAPHVATDQDGNVIVAGCFSVTDYPRSPNTTSLFIAKYNRNGQRMWIRQRAYTYDPDQRFINPIDIQTDEEGNIYLTGDGSNLIFKGEKDSISLPPGNFLVKYTPAGEPEWAKLICTGCGILEITRYGSSFYLLGNFEKEAYIDSFRLTNKTYAGFIARLDTSGRALWAKSVGTEGVIFRNLDANPSNDLIYISGGFIKHLNIKVNNKNLDFYSADYLGYNLDYFMLAIDSSGAARYINVVEVDKGQMWGTHAISPSGNVAVAGLYWGDCTFKTPQGNSTLPGRQNNVSYDGVVGFLKGCSEDVSMGPMEPVCVNSQPLKLSGGTPPGGAYSGPGVSGDSFYPSVAGQGRHWISYSYPFCPGGVDSSQIEVHLCTGVRETASADFMLYPNPVKDRLSVKTEARSYKAEVLNLLGEVIHMQYASRECQIDLTGCAPGVYMLKLGSPEAEVFHRIVKY